MAIGYHYQPLSQESPPHAFRLLVLEPGSLDDPLVCRLEVAKAQDASKNIAYEALSYVWGTEKPTHPIRLGAWPLLIRENLWQLLRARRSRTDAVVLWCDALCINQSNDYERASQVQLMDRIYRGAQEVIVWLGRENVRISRALQIIEDISNGWPSSLSNASDHDALLHWSMHPYWTRTWVVQEFLFAREVRLLCGSTTVDWQSIQTFARCVARLSTSGEPLYQSNWRFLLDSPAFVLIKQRVERDIMKAPLMEVLIRNRATKCQDPRDKVYAMLSLAKDLNSGSKIGVSYRKTSLQLLFDILEHCAILARDLMRYFRFLSELLEIQPYDLLAGLQADFLQSKLCLETAWTVRGYKSGQIIYCESLHDKARQSLTLCMIDEPSYPASAADAKKTKMMNRLQILHKREIGILEASYSVLGSISQRNWRAAVIGVRNQIHLERKRLSRIKVFMPGSGEGMILVGVGYGNLQLGDKVIQFLGNETAIAMAGNTKTPFNPLCGTLLCLKMVGTKEYRDNVTQRMSRFYTAQAGADCVSPMNIVDLQLTSKELRILSQ